jgi:hypothetical protein
MRWADLFERADAYAATETDVTEALATRRDDE